MPSACGLLRLATLRAKPVQWHATIACLTSLRGITRFRLRRSPCRASLTSTTGVPSTASMGPRRNRVPAISRKVMRCRPRGLGRWGERVASPDRTVTICVVALRPSSGRPASPSPPRSRSTASRDHFDYSNALSHSSAPAWEERSHGSGTLSTPHPSTRTRRSRARGRQTACRGIPRRARRG